MVNKFAGLLVGGFFHCPSPKEREMCTDRDNNRGQSDFVGPAERIDDNGRWWSVAAVANSSSAKGNEVEKETHNVSF